MSQIEVADLSEVSSAEKEQKTLEAKRLSVKCRAVACGSSPVGHAMHPARRVGIL